MEESGALVDFTIEGHSAGFGPDARIGALVGESGGLGEPLMLLHGERQQCRVASRRFGARPWYGICARSKA